MFFSILNHLIQAYIVLCTSLLFKEKIDNLQMSRFVLRQFFFCCPRLPGWPGERDYMENFQPGCHVIAKLIFVVFNRRAEILANRASSANRASPAHVIGRLCCYVVVSCLVVPCCVLLCLVSE